MLTEKQKIFLEIKIKELKNIIDNEDMEGAHIEADILLCDILIEFECKDIVDLYNSFDKWYA